MLSVSLPPPHRGCLLQDLLLLDPSGLGVDYTLLVLAALVLEPDADHARIEPRYLHEVLLKESVRPRVGGVDGTQGL